MKYYRFMGKKEFLQLIGGSILENGTEWNQEKGLPATSKGFCFFDSLLPPEKRLAYAFGAIHELHPICVVFKPARGIAFHEGYGTYAKPVDRLTPSSGLMLNPQNVLLVKEYSLTEYDRERMVPLKAGIPRHSQESYEWTIDWNEPMKLVEEIVAT